MSASLILLDSAYKSVTFANLLLLSFPVFSERRLMCISQANALLMTRNV